MSKKSKIKIPVYLRILTGMCVGICAGLVALSVNGHQFVTDWVKPWGQLFIRLLQLVAVPLVFVSLVKGVIGMSDISKFSKMGLKTVGIYMVTTVVAILLGVTLVSVVKPGHFFDAGKTGFLEELFSQTVNTTMEAQNKQGPLSFIDDIVPNNIISALGDNRKMLHIIFFALMFGIAALSVGKEKIKPVISLFNSLNDIILKMIDFVIQTAPYGVMALMAGLVVDTSGDINLFSALAVYGTTVVFGLLFLMLCFYPLLFKLFTKKSSAKHFIKSAYPLQLLAFSTSSSSAVLPVTMDVAKNKLGVSEETTSFVMPLGATINMDGTSCFQAISIIFIAQVLGLDLTLSQILTIILMTTLSSIGTPGVPGGSYVVMAMVLTSVGIPAQGLALILGIDRPLDMLRTSVNVTGDLVVSSIVDPGDNG